jgi:LDH2 family malate/lactate/ureidoglycolate dehydrogenase
VRNSNHAGAAGVYAAMPLVHGMIGIYSAVANANHMAVWGGTDLLLGTNPLAVAIPAGEEAPVVLDIATSIVSYGTIKNHKLQNRPMPEGWMVDATSGAPITDAAKSGEGLLLPMGGYKGSGLAIVLGILAGVLNGAAFGKDVIDFNADDKSTTNTGQFMIALDVARFMPLAAFKAQVDRHLRDMRGSKLLPGYDAIRLPGAERRQRRADRIAHGIPISAELMARLDQLAAALNVRPLGTR